MPVAWYSVRWCDWCKSKNKKEEIDHIFTDELGKWYPRRWYMIWEY